MKPSTIPLICGIALTAMGTAGFSHWWSVRQFVAAMQSAPAAPPVIRPSNQPAEPPPATIAKQKPAPAPHSAAAPDPAQKHFYEALISKMESLQTQNRDLLDQLAETNRDIMKLEFRVDTHSESFRPLPVTEQRSDASLDESFEDSPGVLPPRAEPVFLPTQE
jgi:hypothetical protein